MPSGVEHHDAAVHATAAARSGHPPDDDFRTELWQEYHQLVSAIRDAVDQLHAAAHSAGEAHEEHARRAAHRVERRAAHAHETEQHAHLARTTAEHAHAEVGQHEEGTDAHSTATAAHSEAQGAHEQAHQAHEHAKTKHQHAHEHHEKAEHHRHHASLNRQLMDEIKAIADELAAVVQDIVHATTQIAGDATPEQRAELRTQHQGTIDKIRSQVAALEERLHTIHRESLHHPEDDSHLDQD